MLERPPFRVEDELALITHHAITHVVSKNAGSADAETKLVAARTLAVPVIMVARPPTLVTETYASAEEVVHFLRAKVLP
jgi:precorrin-6A/cobalt-precorrin-6A reductase